MGVAGFGTLPRAWPATRRPWALAAAWSGGAIGGGDEGGHHAAAVLAGRGRRVPLKTHAAPLPGRGRDARRGGLDALVGVADHQLHAGQAPANEVARDLDPEGFGFRGAGRPAENLAPAIGGDANRARDRDADGEPSRRHRFKPDGSSPMAAPPWRTFGQGASIQREGHAPSTGRVEKASTRSSISSQSRRTGLLEMPVPPMAGTRSSIARVETPGT